MVLEVRPRADLSCARPAPRTRYLRLGSTDSIHCPSLSCQGGAPSPELTWYQVRVTSPKPAHDVGFSGRVCPYTESWA